MQPTTLPGRSYVNIGSDRISRLLFHWRARDFSLTPVTGQVPTFVRATAGGAVLDRNGILRTPVHSQPRFEMYDLDADGVRETPGLLVEGGRTNVVLHNRDLTNAAWTKTNATAAKDQTGPDATPNGASSLTATAGNATALQAITLASSARYQTAYVKRITGSGTIEMTMDNGATWTAIVPTSGWTRLSIPTQTLTDPTVGFRIVTNGDAIAVDYVQNENGAFASSPSATTVAAATRNDEPLDYTMPWASAVPSNLTVYIKSARPPWADIAGSLGVDYPAFVSVGGQTGGNRLIVYGGNAARTINAYIGGAAPVEASQAVPSGAACEAVAQFADLTTAGKARVDVGAGFSAYSGTVAAMTALEATNLRLGDSDGNFRYGFSGLMDVRVAQGLFTMAEMREAF